MKYLSNLLATLFLGLVVFACSKGEDQEQIQADLKEEVRAIHDEVMPKMSEINQMKQEILAEVAELEADSLNEESVEKSNLLKSLAADLEDANKSMMDWMRSYKSDLSEFTKEEVLPYLNSEKEKVTEVKNKMLNSIEKAKNRIKKDSAE
jgi:paraquat-inducible protein B